MRIQAKKYKYIYPYIYLSMLFLFLFSIPVTAAEKRTVKVAFFPMEGYHIIESDGSYGGMDVEYLDAICAYTNWEIDYILCDSWEDALSQLENKQVDFVGSAQYSAKRAKIYDYADLSSGYTYGVIATNPDSSLAYEDFAAMRHITYGIVKDYVRKDEFLQYLSDNGITKPSLIEYDNTAALQQALENGSVDAFVHTLTEVTEGKRVIGRFAPSPFYYITYKGNKDVLRELNQAIIDLKLDSPELESTLMNEFFHSRLDKTNLLTTTEKAYIEVKKSITVGYLDGYYPFSYEKDGEFCGLVREILENDLETTGLQLKYKKFQTMSEAKEALANGDIYLLSYYTPTNTKSESSLLYNYAEIPLVLVHKKSQTHKQAKILVTTNEIEHLAADYIDAQSTTLITCNTQQECLTMINNGDADVAICGGYLTEHLLRTEIQYSNLEIRTVLNAEQLVYMELTPEAPTSLKEILSKTITSVTSKDINEHMLKENVYPLVNLQQIAYYYSIPLMFILLVILVIIVIVIYHMIQDSRKIQKLLYKDTSFDIWNLNYLIYFGEHKLLPEHNCNYAIVSLNISQFRRFNIIYGWSSGEKLLETVTNHLKGYVDRKTEICARSQSDRFVLLLQWENWDEFLLRLKNMQRKLEEKIFYTTENHMQLQLGVYPLPRNKVDLRLAVDYANQALEVIGNSGDSLKIYDAPFEAMLKERHEREKLLEAADIWSDFVVYYQSKVDIRTEKIVGAEALVRFKDPSANGQIRAPGYFISYYESTGKVVELDFFVLESTCKMLRKRLNAGKNVVPISCNFSRMHFIKPDFSDHFEAVLQKYEISKELIEVEITETLVVEELQQQAIKKTIDILRERDVRLSIDDFGAGYSSLGVFEQIPASVVKLDRSFLLNQENKDRQVKIMRGIVQMAEDLNAQVVCEGVENADDVKLMKEIHAYVAQGYFYSKPISEEEFEEKLDNNL